MCDVSHALTLLLIHSLSHCWALLHADTCKISSPTEWSTSSLGPFSSKCACFDTPDTNRTPNLSSLTNVPNTILTQALEHHECNCIVADTVRLRTSASAPIDPYTVPNWAAQRNVQNLAGSCPNPSKSLDEERARAGIVDASSSLGVVYPLKYGYHACLEREDSVLLAARFRTRVRVDAASHDLIPRWFITKNCISLSIHQNRQIIHSLKAVLWSLCPPAPERALVDTADTDTSPS
ncbi:hypothetical protein B0H14DRAFT_2581256 [Mycena olivaceomarginata]|nr:hypothetical protein B0H14DRAFT_2581256 [Mycena olivaceomarginata]